MKLLVIITREGKEFDEYWKGDNTCGFFEIPGGGFKTIVLKPSPTWRRDKKSITQIIDERLPSGYLWPSFEEVGVMLHGANVPVSTFINGVSVSVRMNYGAGTEPGFCNRDGDDFRPNTNPNIRSDGVYDRFRDDWVFGREEMLEASFNDLWTYIKGNPALEEKLNYLHELWTNNYSATKNATWLITEELEELQEARDESTRIEYLKRIRTILLA